MKKEDFRFLIDSKKEWEFKYEGLQYSLTYGKDEKGSYIAFGRLYQPVRYYSYTELMNEAKINNSYFREIFVKDRFQDFREPVFYFFKILF